MLTITLETIRQLDTCDECARRDWMRDVAAQLYVEGVDIPDRPQMGDRHTAREQWASYLEAAGEVGAALESNDPARLAGAMVMLIRVTIQNSLVYGIDLRPVWELVQAGIMCGQPVSLDAIEGLLVEQLKRRPSNGR